MDDAARNEWARAEYRFAPYQYAPKNLVYCKPSRSWSQAPTKTRELLMGFRAGHTEAACIKKGWKLAERRSMHLRDSLLGNAMHAPTVALIMAPTLTAWRMLDKVPHPDDVSCSWEPPAKNLRQKPSPPRSSQACKDVQFLPDTPGK